MLEHLARENEIEGAIGYRAGIEVFLADLQPEFFGTANPRKRRFDAHDVPAIEFARDIEPEAVIAADIEEGSDTRGIDQTENLDDRADPRPCLHVPIDGGVRR